MRKLVVITFILMLGASVGCFAARSVKKGNKGQDPAVADSLADLEARKYLSVGLDLFKKEQYEEAIEFYNKALGEYPNHYKTMVAMAVTYQKMNDVSSMEEWYRKIYTVYPDNMEGYLGLGGAFLKLSANVDETYLDSALYMYEEGLKRFPDESDFYYGIAEVLLRQGKEAEADSVFLQGVETNPDNLGIRRRYVEFLNDQERYEDALSHQEYLVNAQEDDPFAHKILGNIYVKLNKFSDAVTQFRKAIELRPDDYPTFISLGSALMQQKNYSEAETVFKQAGEMDTTRLIPHLYLGLVYLNWGKEASAEKEFKYILSVDAEYGDALYYLGVICVRRATRAANQKTKEQWQKGCAEARTATNYLQRAKEADFRNAGRVNQQLEHLKDVKDALKKKLFLVGISDC